MKTKLYKTYSRASKYAVAEVVFCGATEQKAFARRFELVDYGDSTIAERSFSWMPNRKRTLRIFRLRNGDIGFRAFGCGLGDGEKIASNVFDDLDAATSYLNDLANSYINSDRGWTEVK